MENSSIRFLLGLYPKTKNIEKHRAELIKEFDKINEYAKSEELARYEYLDKFVNSPLFLERKAYYKNLTFKNSVEKQKEDEYFRLKNSSDIKFYFKYLNSSRYARFLKMEKSDELKHFNDLKSLVESPQFKTIEAYMKDKHKWEKTEEFHKICKYRDIIKKEEYINYFKLVRLKEYPDFNKHLNTNEIELFKTLESYVKSEEFLSVKSSMKKKLFRQHEAFHKYLEYKKLKKDKSLQNYFKIFNHNLFTNYKNIHNTPELFEFYELEKFVKNPELKIREKQIKALRFNNTEEFKKLKEYNNLAASQPFKDYFKTSTSEDLANFKKLDGSKLIDDYNSLEEYVLSDKFKEAKLYLLDRHKWEKSDELKQYKEYNVLKGTPAIKWYYRLKDNPKFNILRTWHLAFEDDFTNGKINKNNWITKYFWGESVLNDTFALPDEKHLFTGENNININDSSLQIITKNEKVQGKVWNAAFGFFPKEFDFTSGIINTGSSFRTKYGKVEAKVKLTSTRGVFHAFWLSGDIKVPQIDVFKFYNKKILFSTWWSNNSKGINNDTLALNGSLFINKYLIYTIEWTPDKIVWFINGIEVKVQTENIPDELMYISLNSGVLDESAGPLPASFEIDWVRVYQKL